MATITPALRKLMDKFIAVNGEFGRWQSEGSKRSLPPSLMESLIQLNQELDSFLIRRRNPND